MFDSPSSKLNDKFESWNHDPTAGCRGGGPCCNLMGARRARQLSRRWLRRLGSFGQVEGIRYTFNAEFPGVKLSRAREWEPKTGQVTFQGRDKEGKPVKVTYLRSQLSSQSDVVQKEIEPNFTNVNYWLIFPFHVAWDTSAAVTDAGMQKLLPIGSW